MATVASSFNYNEGLLNLLRQTVSLEDRAVELYRRLLAINGLAVAINAAQEVEQLQTCLAISMQEWMPDASAWLCLIEGPRYRKIHLSGLPMEEDGFYTLDFGMAGNVLMTQSPVWLPDTQSKQFGGGVQYSSGEELANSIMVLPFSAMGKVAGCIELISNQPNRFDEIEYNLAFLVATHLSSSLENILTKRELASANARLRDHETRLTQLNQQLQQQAHTDEATGLFNKRRLIEQLDAEIARAKRYGEIMCCLMLDLDHFKQINDTYGHQAGDEVLSQIGALLLQRVRVTDFVARYGGEEFTIILPKTDNAGAQRVAENLRTAVKKHEFIVSNARLHLTVSIGIAGCTHFDQLNAQQIILRADSALYQAKAAGRDRVFLAEDPEAKMAYSQEIVSKMRRA